MLVTGARGVEAEQEPGLIVRFLRIFNRSSDADGIQSAHGNFLKYQQRRDIERYIQYYRRRV